MSQQLAGRVDVNPLREAQSGEGVPRRMQRQPLLYARSLRPPLQLPVQHWQVGEVGEHQPLARIWQQRLSRRRQRQSQRLLRFLLTYRQRPPLPAAVDGGPLQGLYIRYSQASEAAEKVNAPQSLGRGRGVRKGVQLLGCEVGPSAGRRVWLLLPAQPVTGRRGQQPFPHGLLKCELQGGVLLGHRTLGQRSPVVVP